MACVGGAEQIGQEVALCWAGSLLKPYICLCWAGMVLVCSPLDLLSMLWC